MTNTAYRHGAWQMNFKEGQKVLYKNSYYRNEWREGTYIGATKKRIKIDDHGIPCYVSPKNVKAK